MSQEFQFLVDVQFHVKLTPMPSASYLLHIKHPTLYEIFAVLAGIGHRENVGRKVKKWEKWVK
ncbi:MAG: hypothetical protein V7K77_02660 [Nostoc sp.]|uniref:hypothetical protein n=1 Tax=Nostoc sp. TaxID=1180 RepID=UPI002FFCF0D4